MVDKSIGYKLSLIVSIAVIMVFISFITVNFVFTRKLLRQNSEDRAIGLSTEISSIIHRDIIYVGEITSNLAQQATYFHNNNALDQLLDQVISRYPILTAVHASFDSTFNQPPYYYIAKQNVVENGIQQHKILKDSESATNLYDIASNIEIPGLSAPYLNEDNHIVITYFYPVPDERNDESKQNGFIGCTFSLTRLNESINQLNQNNPGYAFLIDAQGNYLTHPDERKILKTNILDRTAEISKNQITLIRKYLQEKSGGTFVAYPEMLNSKKSRIYVTPIQESSWYLIFVVPYNALYNELYMLSAKMVLISIGAIILIFFLVSYIIKKQIRPLSHAASKLSSFSSPFTINTKNEVKQVSNSLEYLKVWFEQYQVAREKEEKNNIQHRRDLQQASEIQQSLIKNNFPAFPNRTDIDLHALYKPAKTVSGDLFDYYFIDDNNLIFTIGDVSGKGIPAAIFMGVCQTVINKNSYLRHPKKIIEKTNNELCSSNHNQYFLTLFLGILNVKTGILTYCNAAHTFPIVLRADGTFSEIRSTHGLPLGLYPNKVYGSEQIRMNKGDTILLFTDGIYDALSEKNIQSGNQWIQNNLKYMTEVSPKEITEILARELSEFESKFKDDICLLAIKYSS